MFLFYKLFDASVVKFFFFVLWLVIPDHSSGKFLVRAKTIKDLNALQPRVDKCFKAAAEATGCTKANGAKDPKIIWKKDVFG